MYGPCSNNNIIHVASVIRLLFILYMIDIEISFTSENNYNLLKRTSKLQLYMLEYVQGWKF